MVTISEEVIGVFLGLENSSYEYIANIIAPYKAEFSVELGNFLLIYDGSEKLVARVIDFVPQGELTSFMGQKWLSDVAFDSEAIGSDIKKRKISYRVKIKILGTLDSKNKFISGLRKVPHITSKVVKPESQVVKEIIQQALEDNERGVEVGHYFLDSKINVKFDLSELDSKKTFIFARAGYGKSNLMKVLASEWKKDYGSLVIFDPDGEYAFTDKKQRPGILDKREAILITNRKENSEVNNVYRQLKLNLKQFSPKFILPIIVPPEKHETIFFSKLMGLTQEKWCSLVDLLHDKKWTATLKEIMAVIAGSSNDYSEQEMAPMRNNLIRPISELHDPNSLLLTVIENAISQGAVVIFDVSLLDSKTALWISSIIVKHTLNSNQRNFVEGSGDSLLKATFVVDEAQSVLSKEASVEAFVELAKEGRKYLLGGIFITQQPATIPFEILSQADNFFVFHLLSRGDLDTLQKANAHYSNDIITQILNEPKKGKCYMWTSSQPFVIPVQILNFEDSKIVSQARNTQSRSRLLSAILSIVDEELKNPNFKSIIAKYREVEKAHAGTELKVRAQSLFSQLTEDEKTYLKGKKGALRTGDGGNPYGIDYNYYTKTLSVAAQSAPLE